MKEKFLKSFTPRDLMAGVIVALVSIPISMGYAQIAGLPMIYGLYGSLLPILVFGLFTTSRDYVFGVDAAPAALVGGTLAALEIQGGTAQAMEVVPMITLLTAAWLLLLYFIRAGKAMKYISQPVMGGFITGICLEIILMQIPKLYGGDMGTGELFVLLKHIWETIGTSFNPASLVLSIAAIVLIQLGKKLFPRFPMSVAVMIAGVLLTVLFHVDRYGVRLLPAAEAGLPRFVLPGFAGQRFADIAFSALSIAVVITSETLLASGSFARTDGYKLDNQKEIRGYALANLVSAFTGCCPVNGSISRTNIVRQFGCSSQWISVSASVTMAVILLFCTGFIQYLPVPVLCAIVVCALYSACEFAMGEKLWKTSRNEFYIYLAALLGVLLFGTVYGVAIGVILSFLEVIVRAVTPPRGFLGVIPGKTGFYDMERNGDTRPIEHVVLYRFGGNLFFANVDDFQEDIENALQPDTKVVVVDAGGIGNVDLSAAERLQCIYDELKEKGIRFYMAGHHSKVNDLLRVYGAETMVKSGGVRMTVPLALRAAGIHPPYELHAREDESLRRMRLRNVFRELRPEDNTQAEMEWAFGEDSERIKEELAQEMIEHSGENLEDVPVDSLVSALEKNSFGTISLMDEDEFLDRLEMHLAELARHTGHSVEEIEDELEKRRGEVEDKIRLLNPEALDQIKRKRLEHVEYFRRQNREAYQRILKRRKEHLEKLKKTNPDLAGKLQKVIEAELEKAGQKDTQE